MKRQNLRLCKPAWQCKPLLQRIVWILSPKRYLIQSRDSSLFLPLIWRGHVSCDNLTTIVYYFLFFLCCCSWSTLVTRWRRSVTTDIISLFFFFILLKLQLQFLVQKCIFCPFHIAFSTWYPIIQYEGWMLAYAFKVKVWFKAGDSWKIERYATPCKIRPHLCFSLISFYAAIGYQAQHKQYNYP